MTSLRTLDNNEDVNEQVQLFNRQQPIFMHKTSDENPQPQDIQQCNALIDSLTNKEEEIHNLIDQLTEKVSNQSYKGGIGFYNAKNKILMLYLAYLQMYKLFKVNGVDLTEGSGLQLYKNLVYYKNLLLKIAPVEKKLDYQTNKMLRSATQKLQVKVNEKYHQREAQADPMTFKARPKSIKVTQQNKQSQGKYVAPKLASTLTKQDKKIARKQKQQERKIAYKIRKFRADIAGDDQFAQQHVQDPHITKLKKKFEQRQRYESQNFIRLPETKQEKIWRKQIEKQARKGHQFESDMRQLDEIRQIFTSKPHKKLKK